VRVVADLQMQVGGLALHRDTQQIVNVHRVIRNLSR
jgi:hypothetical protein